MKSKSSYAKYIVAVSFLTVFANYGTRYTFGVFFKPLLDEFSISRTAVSAIFSLNILVYGLSVPFTGWLTDRFGGRWVVVTGGILGGFGFIMMAISHKIWEIYFAYGVMIAIGSALMGYSVVTTIVSRWFDKKKGLANGITSIGIGAGTLILSPLAGWMIKYMGYRDSFIILGIFIFLIVSIPSFIVFRYTYPHQISSEKSSQIIADFSLRDLLVSKSFWFLSCIYFMYIFSDFSAFTHQVIYARDMGIEAVAAASIGGLIGGASILGRFFFPWLSDHLRQRKYSLIIAYLWIIAGFIILNNVKTISGFYLYALVLGIGYGGVGGLFPSLVSERFPQNRMGVVMGVITTLGCVGGVIGPVIAGYTFELTGKYFWVWNLVIFISLIGVLSSFLLPKSIRKGIVSLFEITSDL
ncbi:MAG: hypothetical protein DRP55_09150 [Spirochaetes bacterium]|nr:MAG: hypothetical protein DRP55_09150 [Spirochaetota bacterium]